MSPPRFRFSMMRKKSPAISTARADADIFIRTVYEYQDEFPFRLYEGKSLYRQRKERASSSDREPDFFLETKGRDLQNLRSGDGRAAVRLFQVFQAALFYGRMRMREYRLVKKRYSPGWRPLPECRNKWKKIWKKFRKKGFKYLKMMLK
ncbi:MAG: hypothetical protein ACLR6B_10360 [Blautia sp.]